jgi:hypothetical protein
MIAYKPYKSDKPNKKYYIITSSNWSWSYTGENLFRLRLQKFVPGVSPQPRVRVLTTV